MYTIDSFLYKTLNEYLRNRNPTIFKNLFWYFILLQHSLFFYFKEETVLEDIVSNL